jgi:hypothetical protein
VNDRHQILKDKQFWLMLEYGMSGWFRTCGDNSLGGFWCDGFIPGAARDTKGGIEVSGIAWVVDGRSTQHKCSFTAAIPQRMLAKRRGDVLLGDLALDMNRRELTFSVAPAGKSPNTSLERTREE